MDDLWDNAWSTPGSKEHTELSKKSTLDGSRWNTFERDADDNTVDVGIPSWSATGWDDGPSNLWQAESSTLDAWETNGSREPEEENAEPEAEAVDEQSEDGKDIAPRTILPTPPQSPLPLPSPSPPPSTPPADTPPPSSPGILAVPSSPDHFGSFESALPVEEEPLPPSSWTPNTGTFPPEVSDEPWGGAWGGKDEGHEDDEGAGAARKDEWELAQEAKRRRERKVPPELLGSLVTQWDEFAKEISKDTNVDDSGSQSWRRGMDNVEGLADLVDSLLPVASLPPPVQFSKTAVAKAVKESLRLSRPFALTRSSPMAHLYASKGSNDWERSVKAQKTAANDEWGWDLKHEPEEKPEPTDSSKEKKGGLLSFWSRRASSIPGDSSVSNPPKSPTGTNHPKSPLGAGSSTPTSPAASARPSIDAVATSATPPLGSSAAAVSSPTQVNVPTESSPPDSATAQPSAVSRFFNRFSRKPTATAVGEEKENQSSLTLSDNDLSLLSDIVPSGSGSSLSHRGTDSMGSLEAMLTSSPSGQRYSSASSSKLPPPLAPPPPPASRSAEPSSAVSQSSDSSFDATMRETQLLDMMAMSSSSSSGYAPVSFDLIDSFADEATPVSARGPSGSSMPIDLTSGSPVTPALSSPSRPHAGNNVRRPSQLSTPTLSPVLPLPLPPPMAPSSSSPRPDAHRPLSSILASTTPPPIPPPRPLSGTSKRSSITVQRFDNPLPPTPQRDADDFSDFLSAPVTPPQRPPPQTQQQLGSSSLNPSTPIFSSPSVEQSLFTPTTGIDAASDFGDFGDFVSEPLRSPSPPKVPRKASRAANHLPAMVLVENAASRLGPWPAPPSPLPQPLAPPPDSGASPPAHSSSMQRIQPDLLSNYSQAKPLDVPSPTTLPSPMFALPPPRPASTSFAAISPSPLPTSSSSRPSTPLSSPFVAKSPSPTTAKSGLSAQDLSFFEGL